MSEVTFVPDYADFTVPLHNMRAVIDILGGDLQESDRGWRGYSHSGRICAGQGLCGWSPERSEMGAHFSLSGGCLAYLRTVDDSFKDFRGFVATILRGLGGHFTRIDGAFDDKGGLLDMDKLEAYAREGWFTSQFGKRGTADKPARQAGFVVVPFGENVQGKTVQFGSKGSKTKVVFYDKAAEQGVGGHWVRCEVRFLKENARRVGELILETQDSLPKLFQGLLVNALNFREPGVDTNKSRWLVSGWWLAFVQYAERAVLGISKAVPTVEQVQGWIDYQVGPSLGVLEEALGPDKTWEFLHGVCQTGKGRFKRRHRDIVAMAGAL